MDTFFEQIVPKKKTFLEWLIIFAVLFVLAVLVFFAIRLPILMFLFAGAAFGGYYLITMQNNEFEYCVTNGDIDIDRINAKRKRYRLVSVSGRKIERLLPYTGDVRKDGFDRVLVTAPSAKEEGLWYFSYTGKKNGHTLVIFQPEMRVLRALYLGLPKLVQMDTDRAVKEAGLPPIE